MNLETKSQIKTQPISKTVLVSSAMNFHINFVFDDDLFHALFVLFAMLSGGVLPHHTI